MISDALKEFKIHKAAWEIIRIVNDDNSDVVVISERLKAIEHMSIADIITKMYADDFETLERNLAKVALAGNNRSIPKKSVEYMLGYSFTKYFDEDCALLLNTVKAMRGY